MIDVLFRVDDGPGIGAGHLMRCRALAEALDEAGGRAGLLASGASPLHDAWRAAGIPVAVHGAPIGGDQDRLVTAELARSRSADWLVIDGYGFDTAWLDEIGRQCRVLCLDDLGCRDPSVAIVLNHNFGAELRCRGAYTRAGRALLGAEWFLLRREWRTVKRQAEPGRMVVTMGGDDSENLALSIMHALLDDGRPFHADVVSSAAPPGFDEARRLAAEHPHCFTLHRAPINLAGVMARTAVAVCGGGVTSVEATSLGVVPLIKVLADNQAPGAQAMAAAGVARVAKPGRDGPAELATQALDMLADSAALADMARRAGAVIDGRGAARVVEVMTSVMQ